MYRSTQCNSGFASLSGTYCIADTAALYLRLSETAKNPLRAISPPEPKAKLSRSITEPSAPLAAEHFATQQVALLEAQAALREAEHTRSAYLAETRSALSERLAQADL